LRISTSRLVLILVLALTTRASGLHAQQPAARTQHRTTSDTAAYSSNAADFIVGKHVFLRSTKTFIGTITETDPNKSFPRGFPRSHMKAVLIQRAESRKDWVPIDGITRIYVTR
jgi:hypothetical protein